jgi:glycerol-3-phosphate cytidylyltransferase-like family protein
MTCVFVSGCYDILHAGYVQFFREARALGSHLTVSFASAEVLWVHKRRRSSLPTTLRSGMVDTFIFPIPDINSPDRAAG